jgi:hypothetical protein
VNRPGKSAAGLLGLALLLGSLTAGCARHDEGGATPGQATEAASTPVAAAADVTTPSPCLAEAATPTPQASDIAPAEGPVAGAASQAPVDPNPTTDPLDSELQTVNQIVNGIDGSLSGSTTSGGE